MDECVILFNLHFALLQLLIIRLTPIH